MWKPALALTSLLGALALVVLLPAEAQTSPSAFGQWTLAGTPPASTGTLAVPGTAVPAATFATDSDTPAVPSGTSTFLGSATPFGAEFGSTQNVSYLALRTVGANPSTTAFTFPTPTPTSGWGFAFGDVDADSVRVEALDAGGIALPAGVLGFRSTFNYCDNTPTPCTGGPHTDVPTWNPATSTLVGSGSDTSGAAGWFTPTAPISSLRVTVTRTSGSPIVQMWVAGHLSPPPTTPTTTTTTAPPSTTRSTAPPTSAGPPLPPTTPGPPSPPGRPTPPAPTRLPDTGAGPTTLPLVAVGSALLSLGLTVVHFAQRRRAALAVPTTYRRHR